MWGFILREDRSSIQLPLTLCVGVGGCEISSLCISISTGRPGFVQAVEIFWVKFPMVSRTHTMSPISWFSSSYSLSTPLPWFSLRLGDRSYVLDVSVGVSTSRTAVPCILTSQGFSTLVSVCCKRKVLWWGQKFTFICGCMGKYLEYS